MRSLRTKWIQADYVKWYNWKDAITVVSETRFERLCLYRLRCAGVASAWMNVQQNTRKKPSHSNRAYKVQMLLETVYTSIPTNKLQENEIC